MKDPRLWLLSESVRPLHPGSSHAQDIKPPAFLRLSIFPETKHYLLLRNCFLLGFLHDYGRRRDTVGTVIPKLRFSCFKIGESYTSNEAKSSPIDSDLSNG